MRCMPRVIPWVFAPPLVALPMQAALAQNAGQTKISERITAVYGTSASDLEAMRANGLGWGEIIMILELAKQSGMSAADIQAMHAGGKGFGQIAKELGINPGELGRAVAAVMSEGRSQGGQGRAQGAGQGKGHGKP